jgi:hypothetical protein
MIQAVPYTIGVHTVERIVLGIAVTRYTAQESGPYRLNWILGTTPEGIPVPDFRTHITAGFLDNPEYLFPSIEGAESFAAEYQIATEGATV